MKKGTVTKILNFVLTIILIIPYSNTDDEHSILHTSDSLVNNISEIQNDIIEEKISTIDPIIEPSVEENVKVAIDSENIGGLKNLDTETDKSDLPNRVSINDAPVLLSTESSPIDLDLSDISVVITSQNEEIPPQKVTEPPQKLSEPSQNIPEPNLNIPLNITAANISDSEEEKKSDDSLAKVEEVAQKNDTELKTEDIPSFSEWAQKRLEEVEKNEQINSSVKGQVPNGKTQNAKLRWKNYASLDCGAKVVAANPEAVSPSAILSPSNDEYKLNPCTARIWFIVELCEAIQAKKIDLANYELFSSSPKEFTVSVSERYPTRDWALIGKFTANDERDIQSFDLDTELFGKYIKVEVKSHYGSEHYCPVSLFRAYGASVFEVLQKEDASNVNRPDDDDDDDDDEDDEQDASPRKADTDKKNIFSSATDAVMSVVKRAAQILGTKSNEDAQNTTNSTVSTLFNICSSPKHTIGCNTCNETLFAQIYELLSCKSEEIKRLVSAPTILKFLKSSSVCEKFGYDFRNSSKETSSISPIEIFFTEKYVGAMCNEVAILESKSVVNVSSQHFANITKNLSNEKIVQMNVQDINDTPNVVIGTALPGVITQSQMADTNVTTQEISQIKPTKTLMVNNANLTQTNLHGESSIISVVPMETVTEIPDSEPILTETSSSTEAGFVGGEGDVVSTEVPDVLDDQLSNIMVDLSVDGQSSVTSASTTASSPQAAKESIFLRLFNRIKALERNMSISSQYLEELSKRYKKQVEEMREETQKRDELNKQLEERLDKLTSTIENMAAERRTFLTVTYCLLFCGLCCFGIYFFCGKCSERTRTRRQEVSTITRRKSMDELNNPPKTEKKRRPSDQVLKIVRYYSLKTEEAAQRKKKKKKKPVGHNRSISLGNLKLNKEKWPCENRTMVEEVEVPGVVLDDSEHSTLEECQLSKEVDGEEIKSSQIESGEFTMTENNSTFPNIIINNEPIKKEKEKEKKGFKRLLKKVF